MTRRVYTLIGAGGTGSLLFQPLLHYLRAYHGNSGEDFLLAVIDGDSVETHNLERQLFATHQVDQNKAEALVGTASGAVAVADYLGADNIERFVDEQDVVIIAVDNYPVRARIAERAAQLQNVAVLNLGNEDTWGNLALWLRRDGKDRTPPITYMHPEITAGGADRAEMSCQQIAELPGGEQTIAANMMSAAHALAAITNLHAFDDGRLDDLAWTELNWEIDSGNALGADHRKAWAKRQAREAVAA